MGLLALFAVDGMNVALPLVLKEAIDALPSGNAARVGWLALLYVALMGLVALGRYFWRVFLIGSSHLVARDLRLRLYGHLLKVPGNGGVTSGDLMSRATNDVESVRLAVGPGVLVAVDAVLLFLMILPVMWSLSPKLTLLAFAFFPLLPWVTARFGDSIDALFESLQGKMSKLSAFAQESFGSVRLVKSLGLERPTIERFLALSGEYRGEGMRLAWVEAPFSPILTGLTYLGTFLILLFGGLDVLSGAITLGTFVAFQRFVVQLSWPMEAIGWAVTMNREGLAAYRRLTEVLTLETAPAFLEGAAPRPRARLLEVDGLRFAYPGGRFRLEVDGLSLERGKRVGIVGPVGSGKSTLFHLLLRLHEPEPGTIFFQGKDIRTIPSGELRRRIGSVEQGIFLFSEPLGVNVGMGAEDPPGESRLWELAETAAIDEEVARLPEGFRTRLGERGVTLSGGQKQRVALMRALGRRPELLLLDDAFSAVDVEVERRILERFLGRHPDLSLLFVSHRLSAMPHMDEIWVFEDGKVTAVGDHRELIRRHAWYGGLWEARA